MISLAENFAAVLPYKFFQNISDGFGADLSLYWTVFPSRTSFKDRIDPTIFILYPEKNFPQKLVSPRNFSSTFVTDSLNSSVTKQIPVKYFSL